MGHQDNDLELRAMTFDLETRLAAPEPTAEITRLEEIAKTPAALDHDDSASWRHTARFFRKKVA